MEHQNQDDFPYFLRSEASLLSHFQSQFEALTPNEKGDRFAEFTRRLVPLSDVGEHFQPPIPRQKTHDKGVDLECESKDGKELLCIQSKYTISSVDDFDLIVNKFQPYADEKQRVRGENAQLPLFGEKPADRKIQIQFMVVTSSQVDGIVQKYEKAQRPSLPFYQRLKFEGRFHVLGSQSILQILRAAYRKVHLLPSNLTLSLDSPFIHMDGVYIGILSGVQLKSLYNEFGDALFLENIREFLGPSSGRVKSGEERTTVNEAIIDTLENEPHKFLAKNNGITFRARSVGEIDQTTLRLDSASIVNGCQTTMCIVQAPVTPSYLLVKVVQTTDSWDIAKAANFQNRIDQIDLDLARFIRPQRIRSAATKSGVEFKTSAESSAYAVLDAIYNERITYDEIRSLFIGIFSRSPNNAIAANYTELRSDFLEQFYSEDAGGENTFDILFRIHRMAQQAAQQIQSVFTDDAYVSLFQRFWKDDKPNYRSFLAILAACGCVRNNVYARNSSLTYQDVVTFLQEVLVVIDTNSDIFIRYYRHAFKTIALDVLKPDVDRAEMLQTMYGAMQRARFDNLYSRLCLLADDDDYLRKVKP